MVVQAPARTPAKRGRPPAPRRATPNNQEALLPEEQTVNGLKVVKVERMQNLPNVPMNILRLTLEDDSLAYGCVDCPEFTGTRDAVRLHRSRVHKAPTATIKRESPLMQLSVGQLIERAEASLATGEVMERLEAERDTLRRELTEITRKYDRLVRALDKVGFSPKMEDDE